MEGHIPVMVESVARFLLWKPGGLYIDATIGLGGHTEQILKRAGGKPSVIGIDRDRSALEEARKRLRSFGAAVTFIEGNFRNITDLVRGKGCDGILLDLGLSSYQLSDPHRGFSYMQDGPLDMAMGEDGRSVRDFLAKAKEEEIGLVLKTFGEERRHKAIAGAITRERKREAITGTMQLRRLIESAVPAKGLIGSLSRSFQALRIWANDELESLKEFLPQAVELLVGNGRLVVISYHSLEDRMIKQFLKQEEKGCSCPPDFPECRCQGVQRLELLTRRPVRPSPEEVETNPRSRSARLRAAKRV